MEEENGNTWWNPGLNNPLNINKNEKYNSLADAARATANNITGIGVQHAYYLNDIVPALKNDVSYDQFVAALRKSIWDAEHYPNPFPKPKIPVYAVPGEPQIFDDVAAAAVAAARTQIGVPYVWGAESPGSGFDCSGLTQWAYQQANVSLPHYSGAQFVQGPRLDAKNTIPQPGDLIFYGATGGEHVIMCTVSPDDLTGKNGKVIQAPQTNKKVFEGPMDGYQIDNGGITGLTRPWATTITPNVSGKSGQNTNNTSGSSSQSSTTSAFNIAFILPQYNPVAIQTYGSPRGFIMDEPVLNSVSQLANASFRSFQSLGTGEFMAWFPDYFGIWGTNAVYQVYEAEITDLVINHSDDPLSTHVAVAGDTTFQGGGQSITTSDWLSTVGIVSVQTPNFMQMLFGDQYPKTFDSEKFLNKYGMRPYISSQPIIRDHLLEFASSANTFMNLWAEQYRTEIGFTFMPEVYPGMRLQFPEIIVQGGCLEVYVQSVVHQGSMSSGFTTRLEITAPVAANPVSGNKSILYLGLD
jgi:cell wall-associated NlpC family hydrolase